MNKTYWDEYSNLFLDKNIKNDLIKFHLSKSSHYFKEDAQIPKEIADTWKLKIKSIIYSDINMEILEYERMSFELQEILRKFGETILMIENLVVLPILTIIDIPGIKKGNYSINLKKRELVLYKDYIENNNSKLKDAGIYITYFLNLNDSILLYGREAYLKGIMQAGYLSYNMEHELKKSEINTKDVFVISQQWQHNLGINITKALLVKVQKII